MSEVDTTLKQGFHGYDSHQFSLIKSRPPIAQGFPGDGTV
jgi:hypothetical protein